MEVGMCPIARSAGASDGRRRGPTPRGCLLVVGAAWLLWILADIWRLGVLGGTRPLSDAIMSMPSLGVALVFAVALVPLVLRVRWQAQRKRRYPAQPWMWHKRWNPAGTRPTTTARVMPLVMLGGSGIGVCVVLATLTFAIAPGQLPTWVGIPFYIAGAGIAVFAGYRAARALRSSSAYFAYDTFPFFLGQPVSGVLVGFDASVGAWEELAVSLQCIEARFRRRQRVGRDVSDTIRSVIWQTERRFAPSDLVLRGLPPAAFRASQPLLSPVLPVAFQLPADGKEWGEAGDIAILWELHVTGRRRGLDVDAAFEVPVYKAPPCRAGL
jgi:hypothetical protein